MRPTSSRLAISIAAAMVAISLSVPLHAQDHTQDFNVQRQDASSGIREFAQQAGIQVIVSGDDAQDRIVNGVSGALPPRAALDQLIAGTGLAVLSFDNDVVVLGLQSAAAAAPQDAASTLDSIVVTGSRVARPELVNPMPVSVVQMDDAVRFGTTNVYDILAENPAIGVGTSLASGSGGWDAGISAVNLRNLGTNRSLTLIDGRRRVSSSARSSAVDIGTIPLGMIDRIEIVTGGAAAVYGADAVTGAVNVITKSDIDETTLSATRGVSDRGDADEFTASLSTGFKFAEGRGRVALGGTYSKTDALHLAQRYDWQDQPLYLPNLDNTGVNDGVHDRGLLWNYRQHYYAYEPNFWLGDTRYMLESGGTVRPMVHDQYWDAGPTQHALGNGGDGRNLEDRNQLRGAQEAISTMGRLEFDFTDDLTYTGWFNYAKTNYDGTGNPWREDARTTFMGVGGAKAYLDNPFLPDPIRQIMLDNGLEALSIDRTYGNFPVREEDHARTTFTFGSELSGNINDYVGWSAFYQYGEVEDDATQGNVPWRSHWLAARDVIAEPATGLPVCRDADARANGCLPLNIFSTQAPSRELLDYVMADRNETRKTKQHLFGAEVSGSAFSLPAGTVNFALGVEHRKETLENRDDPMAISGELVYGGGPGARSELDVEFDVSEIFAEVVVPVLADLPFARRLDVEAAYRYSDYSTVGGTNAWKVGLIWEPIQGLAFRGVRSRSVRTPNFGELYEPQYTNTGTGSIDDPCEAGAYAATDTRAANCLALGVVTPLPDIKTGPHITTGGNPDLEPETSDSLTVGLVWQPGFIDGFDLTVDYWDIDISNVITTFGYSRLLYLCVDLPSIDNPYCALSNRNQDPDHPTLPLGAPLSVQSQTTNAARMYARGVDVGANYRTNLGPGRLGVSFAGTYLIENVTETVPGLASGDVINDGGWTNPELRANLTTSYDIGNLGFAWKVRHHGDAKFDQNTDSDEAYEVNDVSSRTYHDLSARYDFSNGHSLNVGMRNVFDTLPPYLPTIYRNNTVYDLVGRYYSVTWNYRF